MARTPRWETQREGHGIFRVRLTSWKYFSDFIHQEMLDYRNFIWRGQRCTDWTLESTLDRQLKKTAASKRKWVYRAHLENFKLSTRGRRGPHPPPLKTENDWWALGQHFGLSTPLLDWTTSPYVAAYFAFFNLGVTQTQRRSVFAFFQPAIETKSREIQKSHTGPERAPIVEFLRPFSDENARLVNQGGLFSRAPDSVDVETWQRTNFDKTLDNWLLTKIEIPNKDRELALRMLNRMNINHLTLFPDLFGASRHCNIDLQIDKY